MNRIKIPKYRTIDEKTAEAFDNALNAATEELAEYEPKVTFVDKFCARLEFYPKEKVIVESVRDEFALEGICYHCRNCPYLDIPQDRRVKYGSCKYSPTRRRSKDQEACELFYKWVSQNAVEVTEDSELILW